MAAGRVSYCSSWTSSILRVLKKLSATALSQQSPLRLMLGTMLDASSARR